MIITRHIRAMLQVSQDISFWAEQIPNTWHPDAYADEAIREVAERLGPAEALAYAAALAEHAAAELKMEQFQAKGWPGV